MTATFNQATAYTLKEIGQFYDENGKIRTFINMLAQDNPFLEHMLWIMGNETDGHTHDMVTSLPTVQLRALYQGTAASKGGVAQVKDVCRQLSARFGVDVDLLKKYEGDSAKNAFRMQHGRLHIEAMKQKAASYMLYGNNNSNAAEWLGFAPRYPYKDSPNVVDFGGTTDDVQTSLWAVVWDANGAHGIYPKNMKAGIQHEDLGVYDAIDGSGNPYRAIGDEWKWNLGLSVGDWRYVARGCNIDTSKLTITDPDTSGYVDLRKKSILLKNKIPFGIRGRIKWYCSNSVMSALELQASENPSTQLRYGEYFDSKEVLLLHGKPVFECDGILETEDVLGATP